jgi:hypothetical protein
MKVGNEEHPCPAKGTPVKVHYEGRLTNGDVFDSSYGRGDPLAVDIGTGQVIKGWDVGVMSMHLGEKAELTCSPEYAYGPQGHPPKIPENATLIFTVELVEQDGVDMAAIPDEEILKNAEDAKAAGNEAVKAKDFNKAANSYRDALVGL